MKITVRNNVWETNSSSMHAIAVMKNDEEYTPEEIMCDIYVNKKGVWDLGYDRFDLEYGRYPFRILTSFADKVKYAAASDGGYYMGTYDTVSERITALEELVKSICPVIKEIEWPKTEVDAFYDQDGNDLDYDDVRYGSYGDNEYGYYYVKDDKKYPAVRDEDHVMELDFYGYVDHQSMGLLKNFLIKERITLKEFLLKKKYIVVIDGDEYCDWAKYKNARIINVDLIDHEYPPEIDDMGQVSMDSYEYYKRQELQESET